MLPLLNSCISGLASPRTHLLQNWLFPGSLVVWSMVYNSELCQSFSWLCDGMLTHASFDILHLLDTPIAGYHEVTRTDTLSDFKQPIAKLKGVLKIWPLLIARFDDPITDIPEQYIAEREV